MRPYRINTRGGKRTASFTYLILFIFLAFGLFRFLFFRQDEITEFVTHVDHFFSSAGLATMINGSVFDFVLRLWQATVWTENKLFNVAMHEFLQHGIRVSPVNNGTIGVGVVTGLCAKFRSKKLVDFSGASMQAETHI